MDINIDDTINSILDLDVSERTILTWSCKIYCSDIGDIGQFLTYGNRI